MVCSLSNVIHSLTLRGSTMAKTPFDSTIIFRLYSDDEIWLNKHCDFLGISVGAFLRKLITSYRLSHGNEKTK